MPPCGSISETSVSSPKVRVWLVLTTGLARTAHFFRETCLIGCEAPHEGAVHVLLAGATPTNEVDQTKNGLGAP